MKPRLTIPAACLGAALGMGAGLPVLSLDLVRDGRAVAVVVVEPPPAPPPDRPGGAKRRAKADEGGEAPAARVLVDWIRKITDVELPVVGTLPEDGPAIVVGRAAVRAGLALDDIPSPSREGVRIAADDRRVLIAGQSDGATLKAACRFLETLGCRYFMDGPLGEVFPRARTLAVGPLAITERPGLLGRNPKGPSWGGAALWKAWNGAGGETFQHQHAWGRYLPDGLFEAHPDYFALGPDGRRKPGDWLCTSNPALRALFAERVVAAIEKGVRNPSLSPPDGRGYCQCETCRAQDDPASVEPSTGTVSVSSRYADFFADVARRVAGSHPESVLSFYAYADYTQPPTRSAPLPPTLCAVIAPIRYCRLHGIGHAGCPSRLQQVEMIDGWAAAAGRLGYYNYMYNLADATLPLFKLTACKKEFPYLLDRGLSYMTLEILSNWHIYGPQIYLGLRLAYDPRTDADALMEDYWLRFYGLRAAPLMKAYWTGLDAAVEALDSHAGSFFGLQQVYTPEFLERCEGLLGKAAEAARDDPIHAQRVALHAEGLRSAAALRAMDGAMRRGDPGAAKAVYESERSRLRGLAAKGLANREYATAYIERFAGPAVLGAAAAAAPPARLLRVLPDRWRFARHPADRAPDGRYEAEDFDDSGWPWVSTQGKTLDAQGLYGTGILWYRVALDVPARHDRLFLFFCEVDGLCEVFVNGRAVKTAPAPAAGGAPRTTGAPPPPPVAADGRVKARVPFEAEITGAVRPGANVLAVRVDHTKITDLSLGGILRPVLLVERPGTEDAPDASAPH